MRELLVENAYPTTKDEKIKCVVCGKRLKLPFNNGLMSYDICCERTYFGVAEKHSIYMEYNDKKEELNYDSEKDNKKRRLRKINK